MVTKAMFLSWKRNRISYLKRIIENLKTEITHRETELMIIKKVKFDES